MSLFSEIGLNIWVALAAGLFFFIAVIMLNWVNKTIGIKFAWQLFQMKKKGNDNKILLKIWLPNGKPQFKITEIANLIEYTFKENGRSKIGMVKYDYYSMYKDYGGIPVLECDPNDIIPRNPFVNTSLTISGEVIKKNIVDSSKEDLKGEDLKKYIKLALPIIIAVFVGVILYSSSQSDTLAECTSKIIQIAAQNTGTATIIQGS